MMNYVKQGWKQFMEKTPRTKSITKKEETYTKLKMKLIDKRSKIFFEGEIYTMQIFSVQSQEQN